MIQVGDVKSYTVQEAAQMLGLSAVTIRNYIKAGRLKATKAGVSWLITEKNLQNFIEGKAQE